MEKKDNIIVEAVASGYDATSGKIIATTNGIKKEIPAVVFSKTEVKRLFDLIETQRSTMAISNSSSRSKLISFFKKR